ncbi:MULTISPECIES: hypothetical protein [Alphaproteobacteria]|jgi:hypothetical protein|uniref:Uncharacterized protein n=1 Tax=Maricaulis virginensis TaxID=144022 RepID=A0A9W6MQ21_9PROT|nr:hypothetical protein [Maricaulis virginensis]GLK53549.1 hypothetical protein GCM10017621_30570 [Maricaulis virginensis]
MKEVYRNYARNDLKFAKWLEEVDERIDALTSRSFVDYREINYRELYDAGATIDTAVEELARQDSVFAAAIKR